MYKKVTENELRIIAEKCAEQKNGLFEIYRGLFEDAGYGFEYELKFEENPFFGETPYENAFIEVSIFNPEKSYEERYLPECSKKIRLFLLKYYQFNDNIFDKCCLSEDSKRFRLFLLKLFQCDGKILYRKQIDICFYLIMKFWSSKAQKNKEKYLCSEHISDLFIRSCNPFRSGYHAGSYKKRNVLGFILVFTLLLLIATGVFAMSKIG